MSAIRPIINPETREVQLVCPSGRVATVSAGQAICPRCGTHVSLPDIVQSLHRCRESLDGLIEAAEGEIQDGG